MSSDVIHAAAQKTIYSGAKGNWKLHLRSSMLMCFQEKFSRKALMNKLRISCAILSV